MKKLRTLTLMLALSLPLVGCDGSSKNRWNLSTEDLDQAIVLKTPDHKIDYENNTITYIFHLEDDQIVDKNLKTKDVLVWDQGLLTSVGDQQNKWYTGEDLIKAKVTHSLTLSPLDSNGITLEVVTPYEGAYQPSLIIDKKASPLKQYIIAEDLQPNNAAFSMDIKDYSSKIIDQDYDDGAQVAKTILNFALSFAMIIAGAATDSPTGIVSGITSVFNTLFGAFGNEVTNAQLLKEIQAIQQQLKEVLAKLDEIKGNLETLQLITECGFDQAKLLTLEGNWNSFIANYFDPCSNRLNEFEQTFVSYLSNYVTGAKDITLRYAKNEDGQYALLAPFDDDYANPDQSLSVHVSDFTETKKCLTKGTLTKGFVDGLFKDLENAAPESTIKEKKLIAYDAYDQIANDFAANTYFSTDINSDKYKLALDIVNKVCNFADHISGDYVGGASILNDAYQRITLFYNWGNEVAPIWTNFLATIKCYLTYFGQIGQTAALNAHISMEAMNEKIIKASNTIKEFHKANKALKKNYSFLVGDEIEVNIAQTSVDTKKTGGSDNHPTVSEGFVHKLVEPYWETYGAVRYTDLDWSKVTVIDGVTIRRMANRYRGIQPVNKGNGFINYIYLNDGFDWLSYFHTRQWGWLENYYDGFMTGIDQNDMAEGTALKCAWRSNGDYFSVGKEYTYRMNKGSIESQYWGNGKILTGHFVDAVSGTNTFDAVLTGFARYWESHALWFNDEIFGFTTANPVSHYLYMHTA